MSAAKTSVFGYVPLLTFFLISFKLWRGQNRDQQPSRCTPLVSGSTYDRTLNVLVIIGIVSPRRQFVEELRRGQAGSVPRARQARTEIAAIEDSRRRIGDPS